MIVKIPGWRWESLYCLVAAATVLMIRMAASLPHAQAIDLGCLYLSLPSVLLHFFPCFPPSLPSS